MSLDNIWDEPAEETVSRPPKSPTAEYIDKLFGDIDGVSNDDALFNIAPLPQLDIEAEQRKARARYAVVNATNLDDIEPSSSSQPFYGDKDAANSRRDSGAKDDQPKKQQKRVMRLDEGRLLSPNGFPRLISDTRNFKVKGKGHEASDLNRLLNVYRYWTHQLYPKTQFKDTVERVEKLCHSRRMHNALSIWRDEAHGKVSRHEEDSEDDEIEQVSGGTENELIPSEPYSEAPVTTDGGTSSPSGPPSSVATDIDPGNLFDDAFIKEIESHISTEPQQQIRESIIDEDEQMTIWNEIHSSYLEGSKVLPRIADAEDDFMWDMDEIEAGNQVAKTDDPDVAAKVVPYISTVEKGWEEMYD